MSGEGSMAQKPLSSIIDRYRAMLKERETELRISLDVEDVPPPSREEIVRLFQLLLSELTLNSKPIITDLTIIAGEQREHSEGIAEAICARILEVPVEQKLPSLYLVDSIVKNIGREYISHISSHLPQVFCEAYRQVHPNMHTAMRHLFKTWSTVFPPPVLRRITAELELPLPENAPPSGLASLRASESPRPNHGIHVNPKYLEARRQLEHSTLDNNNQHATSTLKIYGQKPGCVHDGYVADKADIMSSRANLSGHKLPPSSAARVANSGEFMMGPGRLSPQGDDVVMNGSPRRVVDRASPSDIRFGYGLGRTGGGEDPSDWSRNKYPDVGYRRHETSATYNNGIGLQRPRALIDAYGNDQRLTQPNNNSLNLNINTTHQRPGTRTWQNTEEEEYDWEDMSPTSVDHRRTNDLLSLPLSNLESLRKRPDYGTHNTVPPESDFRRTNRLSPAHMSVANESKAILEDGFPALNSGHGSSNRVVGLHERTTHPMGSQYPEAGQNFPFITSQSLHLFDSDVRGRNIQSFPSSCTERNSIIHSFPDASTRNYGSSVDSRVGAAGHEQWKPEGPPAPISSSVGVWPPINIQKHNLPPLPLLPSQRPTRSPFESNNVGSVFLNKGLNRPFLSQHQFDGMDNNAPNSTNLPSYPNQQIGRVPSNPQPQVQGSSLEPPLHSSQEVRQHVGPSSAVSMTSLPPPFTHGYPSQRPNNAFNSFTPNPVPGQRPYMPILNAPNNSLHWQGGGYPPLPPGPRPPPSQMMPISQNPAPPPGQQPGGALSGLFSTLMAQGLLSLNKPSSAQDTVGVEFDPDVLKVRHESAITALYADLPRQCTTCGLRFKSQDEHSSHMDWHVTRNRESKNRKHKPSRKWFVSLHMWLTGAEALGTEAVPGFLPTESVVEKKDDEELAVPADEDQNACALCGEPFDDFYSDETEEWMYKGAVYMNSPNGSTSGLNRSQLGPIVHAKCMSDTSVVPADDSGKRERGFVEEGIDRKRLRIS